MPLPARRLRPPRARRAATPALLDRIAAHLPQLRPSEQAVARMVVARPQEVVHLTFPDIAAAAGVSQPTVARFCKAMGFAGFREFKLRLAQALAQSPETGVPFVHRDVAAGDSMAEAAAKVFERAIAALATARQSIDAAALQRAVGLLAAARKVEFYGAGNSGIVALDAQHKFFRLGAPTAAYSDAHVQAMSASLLGRGDAVVAISGSGRSADLLKGVEIARASGASVIALTAAGSPLAQRAHVVLATEASEDLQMYAPMTSRLVHLTLLDALAIGVALRRGPALAVRLKRAKAAVTALMV
ncbi:MAG: SIS domain-containing protein [Betaproteobacteria bacterium]|nr:SIS domain-containing protein [Betaproteobacteria bacterium]